MVNGPEGRWKSAGGETTGSQPASNPPRRGRRKPSFSRATFGAHFIFGHDPVVSPPANFLPPSG